MSVQIDSHAGIHVLFVEPMKRDLMCATNIAGTGWQLSTIDEAALITWPRGLVSLLTPEDSIIVFYGDNTSDLRYAEETSGNWVVHTISGAVGSPLAARLGDDGNLSVIFCSGTSVRLADGRGDQWSLTELTKAAGPGVISAAFDFLSNVHIAYSDLTERQLTYVTNHTGNWTSRVIDRECQVRSLKLLTDPDNDVRIAYIDDFNRNVKYAASDGENWSVDTVTASDFFDGSYSGLDMSIGREGHAVISYYHGGGVCYDPVAVGGIRALPVVVGNGRQDGTMGVGGTTAIASYGSASFIAFASYSYSKQSLYFKVASNMPTFKGDKSDRGQPTITVGSWTIEVGFWTVSIAALVAVAAVVILLVISHYRHRESDDDLDRSLTRSPKE
jgi:hypothetical protein